MVALATLTCARRQLAKTGSSRLTTVRSGPCASPGTKVTRRLPPESRSTVASCFARRTRLRTGSSIVVPSFAPGRRPARKPSAAEELLLDPRAFETELLGPSEVPAEALRSKPASATCWGCRCRSARLDCGPGHGVIGVPPDIEVGGPQWPRPSRSAAQVPGRHPAGAAMDPPGRR